MEEIIRLCKDNNIKLIFTKKQLPLCVAYNKQEHYLVVYKYLSPELIQKGIEFIKSHCCVKPVLEVV